MNITPDLSVPVCCLVFDRKYLVSSNYLEDSLEDIEVRKDYSEICKTCINKICLSTIWDLIKIVD